MDNVWILTNYNDWEKPVADYFKKENLWNKVIINYEDFFNPKHSIEILPIDLYDKIYCYLPQFMDMISRNSPINQNTYSELNIHDYQNLFNLYINFYYTLYKQEKITLYVTNRAPHVGFDLVACIVASIMGIKTLILEQSLFPNRFFMYSKHEDYGDFYTSNQVQPHEKIIIEKKHEKEIFYMKKIKLSYNERFQKYFKEHVDIQLIKELLRRKTRNQAFYRHHLKKQFSKNRLKNINNVNLNDDFIYFALHLQPEKTTSSWGGKYVDQVLALEQLSQLVPENVKIYVKENPKQGYFMRGEFFYERLKNLKNVFLVPNETDTYDLIKNCLFVATITGTVGWEAISGGKNVLIFGWGVWYKSLSGVFSFENGFSYDEIVSYRICEKELETKINHLLAKTGKGVVYTKQEGYKSIVKDFSFQTNIENLSKSIKNYLYNV